MKSVNLKVKDLYGGTLVPVKLTLMYVCIYIVPASVIADIPLEKSSLRVVKRYGEEV